MTNDSDSPASEKLWTARTWPFIISALSLMTFIAFESFAVTTVLPVAMTELGDLRWYSFAYAATITTALIGIVIGGNSADRHGPRAPLAAGGLLFLLGLIVSIAAPDTATFILGRLFQGVGGGIDSVVLYVLIARHIPKGPRPRMFGLLTTAWLIPSLAGPIIAGALTDLTSWRTVFGIVLVGAAISLFWLFRVSRPAAPEPRIPVAFRANWSGIIGRSGALAILAAGLLIVLHVSGHLEAPASLLIVGVASLALAITARGILPSGTLRLRGIPQRLVALRAILGATVSATDLYLTLYLQTERGYTPTAAGLVIAVGAGGWALGAWNRDGTPILRWHIADSSSSRPFSLQRAQRRHWPSQPRACRSPASSSGASRWASGWAPPTLDSPAPRSHWPIRTSTACTVRPYNRART